MWWFVSLLVLSWPSVGCAPQVTLLEYLRSNASNDVSADVGTSPFSVVLRMPDGFMGKVTELDYVVPEVWPWYFERSLKSTFSNYQVIPALEQKMHMIAPESRILVEPQLWGYFCDSNTPNSRYHSCWIDLRYRLLDKDNNVVFTLNAEGIGYGEHFRSVVAFTMNAALVAFQQAAKLHAVEIVDAFRKRYPVASSP
jgi:hypothetical protein